MSRRKNLLLASLMTPSLAFGPQGGTALAAASERVLLAQAAPGLDPDADHPRHPPRPAPGPMSAPRPAPAPPPAVAIHPEPFRPRAVHPAPMTHAPVTHAPTTHAPSAPQPGPRPARSPALYPGAGAPPMPRPQLRAAPPQGAVPRPPAALGPAIIRPPQQAAPIRPAPTPHPTAAPSNPAPEIGGAPSTSRESHAPAPGRHSVLPAQSGPVGVAGTPPARRPPAPTAPTGGPQPAAAPAAIVPPHSEAPPAGAQNGPRSGPTEAPARLGGPQPAGAAGAPEAPTPRSQPPAQPAQGGGFLPPTAAPGAPRPDAPPAGGPGDHAGQPPSAGSGRFLPPGGAGATSPGSTPGAAGAPPQVPVPPHVPPQAGGAYPAPAGGPPQPGAPYGAPPSPPPHGGGPRVSPAAAAAIGAAAGLVGGFVLSQPGTHRLDDIHGRRQQFERDGVFVVQEPGRTIVRDGGGAFIRHDENERFRELGGNLRSERRGDEYVSVYARRDGGEVLTYTDANGVLLRRIRRFPDGREIILIDNGFRGPPRGFAEEIVVLPPPPVEIAPDAYVVDYGAADERMLYETLTAPPLAPVPRRYTLDEIRYSPSLRAYTRSVDIDTINFDTGSWAISPDQAQRLALIAEALNQAIRRDPAEVFLVEGHTDAVGSDVDNLSLSDRRAQAVATILSRDFGVPPENLTTQGYGEQYRKVQTQGPSRENRRVTVRRITPLLNGPQAETQRRR